MSNITFHGSPISSLFPGIDFLRIESSNSSITNDFRLDLVFLPLGFARKYVWHSYRKRTVSLNGWESLHPRAKLFTDYIWFPDKRYEHYRWKASRELAMEWRQACKLCSDFCLRHPVVWLKQHALIQELQRSQLLPRIPRWSPTIILHFRATRIQTATMGCASRGRRHRMKP